LKPDLIALYISEPEILGLEKILNGEIKKVPLSRYEVVYARKLAYYAQKDPDRYGEVQVPPPCLIEGLRLSRENKVPVVALDMDDSMYASAYTDNVSTLQLVRHSMRFKKLSKKEFNVQTPEEFTFAWDSELTKLSGFSKLEKAREIHMAQRLLELVTKFDTILAVLELERLEGVLDKLKHSYLKRV
jgi:hypothetical protein